MALLQQHGIEVLADVRSTPFSRFNPQFNRRALAHSLAAAGIRYEYLGEELGARSSDPACYRERPGELRAARRDAAVQARPRARAIEAAKTQRVAMMCAEREPLDCHRTILVDA